MLMQRGTALDSIQRIVDLPHWKHPSVPHFCVTFIMVSANFLIYLWEEIDGFALPFTAQNIA